jgi:hypothetical protein
MKNNMTPIQQSDKTKKSIHTYPNTRVGFVYGFTPQRPEAMMTSSVILAGYSDSQ